MPQPVLTEDRKLYAPNTNHNNLKRRNASGYKGTNNFYEVSCDILLLLFGLESLLHF